MMKSDEALSPDQQMVDLNNGILTEFGEEPNPGWKILDFGCGSGRHVYEYRDRFYNCLGFDRVNYVSLRDPSEAHFFCFSDSGVGYHVPHPDASFDFVFSTSVFEHVLDHEGAFREIHRVLKAGGVSIHVFPARYRPIEPHIFGGLFPKSALLLFLGSHGNSKPVSKRKGRA
jgi:SAM-dependent methyltransferase